MARRDQPATREHNADALVFRMQVDVLMHVYIVVVSQNVYVSNLVFVRKFAVIRRLRRVVYLLHGERNRRGVALCAEFVHRGIREGQGTIVVRVGHDDNTQPVACARDGCVRVAIGHGVDRQLLRVRVGLEVFVRVVAQNRDGRCCVFLNRLRVVRCDGNVVDVVDDESEARGRLQSAGVGRGDGDGRVAVPFPVRLEIDVAVKSRKCVDLDAADEQNRVAALRRERDINRSRSARISHVVNVVHLKRNVILLRAFIDRIRRLPFVNDVRCVVDRRDRNRGGKRIGRFSIRVIDRILEGIRLVAVLRGRIVDRLLVFRNANRAVARVGGNHRNRIVARRCCIVGVDVLEHVELFFHVLDNRKRLVAIVGFVVDGVYRHGERSLRGQALRIAHRQGDLARAELVRGGNHFHRAQCAGCVVRRVGDRDITQREEC